MAKSQILISNPRVLFSDKACRKSLSLMKGAFSLWLPLLEQLDSAIPTFAEQLVISMLESIKLPSMSAVLQELNCSVSVPCLGPPTPPPQPSKDTELNKALVAWIKQLTGNSPDAKFGKTASVSSGNTSLDIEIVARKCFFSPNKWYFSFFQTPSPLSRRTLFLLTL